MGYRDDSPFKEEPYLDINTPTGQIDMSQTGTPLMANGRMLPPYSGMHQFEPGIVREEPMHQMPDGSWMTGETHGEYEELELTDEEIEEYRKGGYVVEEMQGGGQAYNDSLTVHNFGEQGKKYWDSNPSMTDWNNYVGEDMPFEVFKAFNRLEDLNGSYYKPSQTLEKQLYDKEGPYKGGAEAGVFRWPKPKGSGSNSKATADSLAVYNAGKKASDLFGKITGPGENANTYAKAWTEYQNAAKSKFGTKPSLEDHENYKPKETSKKRPYVKPIEKIQPKGLQVDQGMPNINTTPREGAPELPQPTITGYTQQWNPETKKYIQEPQYQVIPEPTVYRQDGGTIYTNDPNDPALRNYNDSLTLHNTFKGDIDKLKNTNTSDEWWKYVEDGLNTPQDIKATKAYGRLLKNDSNYKADKELERFDGYATAREYPKPTQPVKYRKEMQHVKSLPFTSPDVEKDIQRKDYKGAQLPPQPTLTGYTQTWDPETRKYIQEPQYQVIAEADANRYKQEGGAFEEVDLTDEQIAAYRAQGIRVEEL